MKTLIEKSGIKEEHLFSREQLKQVTGGASPDLHCRCVGSVGCWSYGGGGGPNTPTHEHIENNCSSGVGECAYVESYCEYA